MALSKWPTDDDGQFRAPQRRRSARRTRDAERREGIASMIVHATGFTDDEPANNFVLQPGTYPGYWPHTPPEDRRVYELREDENGNVYGVQVSGPPEPDPADGDTWETFTAKLVALLDAPDD